LITTTDFFTPIIDDPYLQGQIAACNATNDVYAKGAVNIISVLVLMGMPETLPLPVHKDVLRGFCDFCKALKAPVLGGHTIVCPWPIMGGAVTAVADSENTILISKAEVDDRLILTKPLGIQPLMKALRLPRNEQEEIARFVPEDEISQAITQAIDIMTQTDRDAALAMLETGVHAATDVTGFGLLGHASNMAEESNVSLEINVLPVIRWAPKLAELLGYPLLEGRSSETAGGLLISLPEEKVDGLLKSLKKRGCEGHEIGIVKKGPARVEIHRRSRVIEVPP
jgi:selenide,water dikinase